MIDVGKMREACVPFQDLHRDLSLELMLMIKFSKLTVITIKMLRMKMMIYLGRMREDCAPLQDLHRDGN